jgi:SAM-dependent methyltransferase
MIGVPSNGKPYESLSRVYDRWQGSYGVEYAEAIVPRVLSSLRRAGKESGRIIDLGCGTGTLTIELAERGWTATGIDQCRGMIAEARRKSNYLNSPPAFFEHDIRRLQFDGDFDAAVCVYDVINHLQSSDALALAFESVFRALLPGGVFVFDVNNLRCYRTVWRDEDTIHQPGFVLHIANSFDETEKLAVSEFVLQDALDGTESRETLVERCYSQKEIREALRGAGFIRIAHEDFAFPGVPAAGLLKTWWVAVKPGITSA